jgi:O-acetylserine/cysteine efflux transporter
VAGYGFSIGVCQFALLFLGIKLGMPAGLSSVVIQIQVFFTVGLGIAFLGEQLRREDLIGAAIATAGLVLLGIYKAMAGVSATMIGFVLVIAAAFAWAVGNVVAKRAATEYHADMFALVVWSSLVPPLPLAALAYAFEGGVAVWPAVSSASALTAACWCSPGLRRCSASPPGRRSCIAIRRRWCRRSPC